MRQLSLISSTRYTGCLHETSAHLQRILCHPGNFPEGAGLHAHKDSRSHGSNGLCLPLLVAIATQYHELSAGGTKLGSAVQSVPVQQRAGVAFYIPSSNPAEQRRIATIRPGANAVYAMLGGMNASYQHAVVKAAEPSQLARTAVVSGSY